MIDTIILTIPRGTFNVLSHSDFTSPMKKFENNNLSTSTEYAKYIQNPPKNDPENRPRLTLYERPSNFGRNLTLKMEFSIPKLLYHNNLDEICQKDYGTIISTLIKALYSMGIQTTREAIAEAQVSNINFSKNILLDDYTTSSMILKELIKIDLNEKFDLTESQFRNGGQAIHYYSNSCNIILYDKISDIFKSEKRATDKDQNKQQLFLFNANSALRKNENVLKFEIRLTEKRKLRSILEEVNFYDELIFSNVFKEDLAKKVIRYFWEKMIEDKAFALNACQPNTTDLLSKILNYKYDHKNLKNDLAIFGALTYINIEGIRGLKKVIERYFSSRTWKRFKKTLKVYSENQMPAFFLKQVSDALEEFKPLKSADVGLSTLNDNKSKL